MTEESNRVPIYIRTNPQLDGNINSFVSQDNKEVEEDDVCRQPDNLIVDFSGFYEEKIQNWQTYLYRKPTLEDVDLAIMQDDGVIIHDRINTYE